MSATLVGPATQASGAVSEQSSARAGGVDRKGSASEPQHPVFWLRAAPAAVSSAAQPGAAARAILCEIRDGARRLLVRGECSSIDLRCLKSMPQERATLARLLGSGDVVAVVELLGRTEIHETGIPCVWWVRHLDSAGETVGELIEITEIPDLLVGDRQAIALGLDELRARETPNTPTDPQARYPS